MRAVSWCQDYFIFRLLLRCWISIKTNQRISKSINSFDKIISRITITSFQIYRFLLKFAVFSKFLNFLINFTGFPSLICLLQIIPGFSGFFKIVTTPILWPFIEQFVLFSLPEICELFVFRSGYTEVFYRKRVLENSAKFTEKYLLTFETF